MILTKEEVKSALAVNEKDYETSLIRLNTLPNNALFTVDIEESVFAMYFDKVNKEYIRFKLDYEYSNQNVPMNVEEELHKEIRQDLLEELRAHKEFKLWSKHYQKVFNIAWFLMFATLFAVLGYVYIISNN